MKMKGWPTHPNKRTTGEEPKTTKEGHQQQQGRGRRQEARGGGETATSSTTSTTRSALVGAGFGMRFAFDEQQHTTHKHKRRRGTQQGREGNKHTPDPGNNQGQPWKGRKKQKANTPEGRQQKRRRWGGGRTTPWKPEKDTKDLTQPNLPGDAKDQPNPNTKTHYREGPKGDKQITNQKESCSKRVH